MEKLDMLVEIEGYENINELLEERGSDSTVPGICVNNGCSYTTDVEPDQQEGWCEECKENSVKSFLVLLGII